MVAGIEKFGDTMLRPAAQRQLQPGERLVWTGRPRAGALAASRIFVSLFGVVFLAFSLFWITSAMRSANMSGPAPMNLFPLFGIPFALVGVGLVLWAPFAAIQARYITYAITDRRALVINEFPWMRVRSYGAGDLGVIERTERADGSGSVTFHQEVRSEHHGEGLGIGLPTAVNLGPNRAIFVHHGGRQTVTKSGFLGIPAVRTVEDHLLALKSGRKSGPWG